VITDRNQNNIDNLNKVRREVRGHLRNRKKEYLKVKIEELESNSKIKVLGTCIGASVTLTRVAILELI